MKIRTIAFTGAVLGIGIVSAAPVSAAPAASSPILLAAAAAEYGQAADSRAPKREREGQTRPAPRRKPSPPVPGQSARGPAYKEECVWVGKRVVSLLARDDAMAANDFMPFYSQFNCPADHIAKAFACVVTDTDPSENEALADRIDVCWDNPEAEFPPVQAPDASAAGEESGKNGTKPSARDAKPEDPGSPPGGM